MNFLNNHDSEEQLAQDLKKLGQRLNQPNQQFKAALAEKLARQAAELAAKPKQSFLAVHWPWLAVPATLALVIMLTSYLNQYPSSRTSLGSSANLSADSAFESASSNSYESSDAQRKISVSKKNDSLENSAAPSAMDLAVPQDQASVSEQSAGSPACPVKRYLTARFADPADYLKPIKDKIAALGLTIARQENRGQNITLELTVNSSTTDDELAKFIKGLVNQPASASSAEPFDFSDSATTGNCFNSEMIIYLEPKLE